MLAVRTVPPMLTVRTVRPMLAMALLLLAWLPMHAQGQAPAPIPERDLVREPFTLEHLSSDWEVLLPIPNEVWPSGGWLRVVPGAGADWDALGRIRNLVRYRRPLVGSRLEVRTAVEIAIDAPGTGVALVLYQDDANWVELAVRGELLDGELQRVLRLTRLHGGARETVVRRHGRGPSPTPEELVLVLERESDLYRGRIEVPMGPPGVFRRGTVGEVRAPGFRDLQLMLKAARLEPPASSAEPLSVGFDDVVAVGRSADAGLGEAPETLRVSYATDFRDPEAFQRDFTVLRPDTRSLVLENGLELVATYGIPGDRWTPIRNLVVWNQPLRASGWDVEVEVDVRFTSRHDDVGIMLYGERGNALYVGHWALPGSRDGTRQAYLRTVEGGKGETRFTTDPGARTEVEPTTLIFRIERTSEGYVSWIDVAGRGWVRLGESRVDLTEPRIGMFARSARDLGPVPGAGVRFARLWVMTARPAGPAAR